MTDMVVAQQVCKDFRSLAGFERRDPDGRKGTGARHRRPVRFRKVDVSALHQSSRNSHRRKALRGWLTGGIPGGSRQTP